MKKTLLFVLVLVAAVPVDGVAQDGLDSDTTVREFFDHLGAAVESLFEALGDLTLGSVGEVLGGVVGVVFIVGLLIGGFVLLVPGLKWVGELVWDKIPLADEENPAIRPDGRWARIVGTTFAFWIISMLVFVVSFEGRNGFRKRSTTGSYSFP